MLKTISKYIILVGVFLFLSLTLSCKKPVVASYTDVDAIKDYIYTHPSIFSADVFDTDSTDTEFYREITKKDQIIKIIFYEPDTTYFLRRADVWWDDTLYGVFHTFISGNEYTKEFKAFSRVRAYFEQWGSSGDVYRGWLLMKVSNLEIYTWAKPGGFSTVEVSSEGITHTVLINQLFDLSSVLEFAKSKKVTFTIEVTDASGIFLLHIYEEGVWKEVPFNQVSGTEYEASWTTSSNSQDLNVYKHAYIDYLDNKSVTEPSYAYRSRALGVLYQIK